MAYHTKSHISDWSKMDSVFAQFNSRATLSTFLYSRVTLTSKQTVKLTDWSSWMQRLIWNYTGLICPEGPFLHDTSDEHHDFFLRFLDECKHYYVSIC